MLYRMRFSKSRLRGPYARFCERDDAGYDHPASPYSIYAAGDTIVEEIIPDSLPDNYRFLKLTYTTTANESSEKVDAYVVTT